MEMVDKESFKTKVVELAIEKMDKDGTTLVHDGQLMHRETLKVAISPELNEFISMIVRYVTHNLGAPAGYTFKTINSICPEGIKAYPDIKDGEVTFDRTVLRSFDNIYHRETPYHTSVAFMTAQFSPTVELDEHGFPNLNAAAQDVNDIQERLSEHYQSLWQKAHDLKEQTKNGDSQKGVLKYNADIPVPKAKVVKGA